MSLGLLAPRVCALGRWQGGQESLGVTHSPQKSALAAVCQAFSPCRAQPGDTRTQGGCAQLSVWPPCPMQGQQTPCPADCFL